MNPFGEITGIGEDELRATIAGDQYDQTPSYFQYVPVAAFFYWTSGCTCAWSCAQMDYGALLMQ